MTEKTLFLYDRQGEGKNFFFELEGNYSHLDGVYINGCYDEDLTDELMKLLFDEAGEFIVEPLEIPTRDWTYFVKVGFFP